MEKSNATSDKRPWGEYHVLAEFPEAKVKTITVHPGHQISYQFHKMREEHWLVIKGNGIVILDDATTTVSKGTYIHIKKEQKHRIKNTGVSDLQFIEVQLGEYFGEDDIVRLSDDYKR